MTGQAVVGMCEDCRRASFVDLAPTDIEEAVCAASRFDRLPQVLPVDQARTMLSRPCRCVKAQIARRRGDLVL